MKNLLDFTLILFLLTAVTGLISLLYRLIKGKNNSDENNGQLPVIVEYARALFPVFLIVFTLRSFLVEPFRIPSGSMIPTLHVGDFILVNKFSYGIRLPVINTKVFDLGDPERGDVMVFRFPGNPKINYIKRVIGLPGDELRYENKQLYINDQLAITREDGEHTFEQGQMKGRSVRQLLESFGDSEHTVIVNDAAPSRTVTTVVPEGHYFMMGDNRDGSNDSRRWGFVPEENIVGKAFFIWMSWKGVSNGFVDWKRIGNTVQ